jgi:hypothetical protein
MDSKTPEERAAIARKSHATRKANNIARKESAKRGEMYSAGLQARIDSQEKKLAEMNRAVEISLATAELTGKRLLSSEEISAAALPWGGATGVYFLLDGDEVVYVGQSVNIYKRIAEHKDKKFDRFAYLPCARDALDKLESIYIHVLQPKLNGLWNCGAKAAPIRFDRLFK